MGVLENEEGSRQCWWTLRNAAGAVTDIVPAVVVHQAHGRVTLTVTCDAGDGTTSFASAWPLPAGAGVSESCIPPNSSVGIEAGMAANQFKARKEWRYIEYTDATRLTPHGLHITRVRYEPKLQKMVRARRGGHSGWR